MNPPLVLASASPRRRRILRQMGLRARVIRPAVEEVCFLRRPERSACVNARRKHDWARERFPDALVLAADTVIAFRGRCIGKPRSISEAQRMLRAFSGREHRVLTAVAWSRPGRPCRVRVVESRVRFRVLSRADVASYTAAVNPLDKAGAYDIASRGARVVESFRGSRSNIMGLPVETVARLLARTGPGRGRLAP